MSNKFVVCWDNVIENVNNIRGQVQDFIVINSGSQDIEEFENVGDIGFYRQFYYALKNFDIDSDYLLFVTGDAIYNNWEGLILDAQNYFNKYDIGAYAPYFTNTPWGENQTSLCNIYTENNLNISSQTDGIVIFLRKDVAIFFKEYFEYLEKTIDINQLDTGWGLDLCWCAYIIAKKKYIFRDSKHLVTHDTGSSYSHDSASQQMEIIINNFIDFCNNSEEDGESISKNIGLIYQRMGSTMNANDFYDDFDMLNVIKDYSKVLLNYHLIYINDERLENINRVSQVMSGHNKLDIKSLNAKDEKELQLFYEKNPEFRTSGDWFKLGEIGNFGSHLNFWKHIVKNNLDYALILEDDILIQDNFLEQCYLSLKNLPEDWDIFSVYVDENQYPRYTEMHKVNDYISRAYQDWSTLCYFISNTGAKKILKDFEEKGMHRPTDWYIFRGAEEGLFNVYTLPPNISPQVAIDKRYTSQVQ